MTSVMVGDIDLCPLSDGEFVTGPEYFGPGASFASHADLVDEKGTLHMRRIV
jgi:hypothetical protein